MSRDELAAWLEARRPAPPASLAARLRRALAEAPAATLERPIPEALLAVGRSLVEAVVRRPDGGRECALDLLAADAFITYAFEAQAELDIHGLNPLANTARGP